MSQEASGSKVEGLPQRLFPRRKGKWERLWALRAGTCPSPGHPTMVPGHFHPPLQVQAAAGLLALETRGVHFVTAEGLGEVCGVLSRQATGGWQAGGALGMAHELAF